MLLKNISIWRENPLKRFGSAGAQCLVRSNFNYSAVQGNRYVGEGSLSNKDAINSGAQPPYTWSPAIKPGGMATFTSIRSEATLEAGMAGGVNLEAPGLSGSGTIPSLSMSMAYHLLANLTGAGTITSATMLGAVRLIADLLGEGGIDTSPLNILAWCQATFEGGGTISSATLQAPVPLSAGIVGSGTITSAALIGLIFMLADVEGSGSITPDLKFPANLISPVSGAGDLTSAILKGISWCVANIVGEGEAAGDLRGKSFMSSDITSAGEMVTAASCANAVWEAVAALHNNPGTMGNKMNSASAAGDPWTAELPGSYTEGQAGRLLADLPADVKEQIETLLFSDATVELSEIPNATSAVGAMVQFIFMYFRNKRKMTSTKETLYKDDGTTVVGEADYTESETESTKGKIE